jgi:hypothetical protein
METNDNEDSIDSLLDQLKHTTELTRNPEKAPFNLKKEDLEQFILNNTGRLIEDSMDTIDNIKQFIVSAPEPEDVHSLAELYKASTSAIEALNKVLLQQQKAETQIKVKVMDIESKQAMLEQKGSSNTLTRQEILDKLMNSGDIIEIKNESEED